MSESKRVLTKKDITNLAIRSSLLQAGFSYERSMEYDVINKGGI